jgi:hypothetical protein
MYSIGLATSLLYLASLITFLLKVHYGDAFPYGLGLSALLFIVATVALLVMMRKRMEKQNF